MKRWVVAVVVLAGLLGEAVLARDVEDHLRLKGGAKVITVPSAVQSLNAAGNQISANSQILQVNAAGGGKTAAKSTNNTLTAINSIGGSPTNGTYNLRVTSDNGGPPAFNFYYNGVLSSGSPYSGWPVSTQISINGGASAGTLTFTTESSGPGPLVDLTDVVTISDLLGDLTLTSAPTIANGSDGEMVTLINTGTSGVLTIQDQGTLSSSNLRLTTTTLAIGPGD